MIASRACTHKSGSVIDVHFTPDATELLRSNEMNAMCQLQTPELQQIQGRGVKSFANTPNVRLPRRVRVIPRHWRKDIGRV